MRTIWRFDFNVTDVANVAMPEGARILPHVGQRDGLLSQRDGLLSVWAEVDSDKPLVTRKLHVARTGNPFDPKGLDYIGSVITQGFAALVWHVYALPEAGAR